MQSYGNRFFITERVSRVLRFGLHFFGTSALSVIPAVLTRITLSFGETGFSSCLWIAGKIVQQHGDANDASVQTAIQSMFSDTSSAVSKILQSGSPNDFPDVIEDYLQLSQAMLDYSPQSFYASAGFETTILTCLVAMTMIHSDIVFASLDLIRTILSSDVFNDPRGSASPNSMRVREILTTLGFQLVGTLLTGLTGNFPEEAISVVTLIFQQTAILWPSEMLNWLPTVLISIPPSSCPQEAKSEFLLACQNALSAGQTEKVKQAITNLFRAFRKTRARREVQVR